jgi:DNA-binding transcriptional LysR family regulator
MELRYLDTFICAAELGSFSLAAKQMNYAQSTVTTQIDSLEKELSVKLFDRNGKRVTLSGAGRDLMQYAYRFQQLQNDLHHHFSGNEHISGELRVGIIESLCVSKYMKGVEQFLQNCPEVTLRIIVGTVADIKEKLHKGEIDMAFIFDRPVTEDDFDTLISFPKNVLFITAPDDEILNEREIVLSDLCHKEWFLTETGCNYRRVLDDTLSDRRLVIKRRLEIGQTNILISYVQKGMGISLLPEFTLMEELQKKTIVEIPVRDCKISMELQLLIHKNRWLPAAARAFSHHMGTAMRR